VPIWRASGARRIDLLGLGENSLDRLCVVDSLPQSGEKLPVHDYAERPGGQVATTVLGCQRLGLQCAYAGAVGDDAAAKSVLEPLREARVDLSSVRCLSGVATRQAIVLVERDSAERCVLGVRDPRLSLGPGVPNRDTIASARVLAIDTSDCDAGRWAARIAREAATAVVLDADEPTDDVLELVSDVDFPIVSTNFAESMGEGGSPERMLRELAGRGARMSVVTLGYRGALALTDDRTFESPAYAVRAIDTTGAGDAFRSGFIWALVNGRDPVESLRMANATAAMNCRGLGAQAGLPTLLELEKFLAE
jgi:sulfofructose kinase